LDSRTGADHAETSLEPNILVPRPFIATLPRHRTPESHFVVVQPSALDQIPQQVCRHRQLSKRKATSRDLLDRASDTGRLRMGREPVPGGLLAGIAICQHAGDQSSFRGRDLVNGPIDGETFEIIVRRNAARAGDDAIEAEIGLDGKERRLGVTDGPVGTLRNDYDIRCRDQGVEIGEFAGKVGRDAGIDQVLPPLAASGLQVLRQGPVESGGDLPDTGAEACDDRVQADRSIDIAHIPDHAGEQEILNRRVEVELQLPVDAGV
jgi:hypothetical protein